MCFPTLACISWQVILPRFCFAFFLLTTNEPLSSPFHIYFCSSHSLHVSIGFLPTFWFSLRLLLTTRTQDVHDSFWPSPGELIFPPVTPPLVAKPPKIPPQCVDLTIPLSFFLIVPCAQDSLFSSISSQFVRSRHEYLNILYVPPTFFSQIFLRSRREVIAHLDEGLSLLSLWLLAFFLSCLVRHTNYWCYVQSSNVCVLLLVTLVFSFRLCENLNNLALISRPLFFMPFWNPSSPTDRLCFAVDEAKLAFAVFRVHPSLSFRLFM